MSTPRKDPIRTLIIDDERPARDLIKGLLRHDADITVTGELATGAEAVDALNSSDVDLAFLDVQLPDFDGFEVLKRIEPQRTPYVIFATAHDEHAIRAFDVHAVDYLLKPFSRARFYAALQKAKKSMQSELVMRHVSRLTAMLSDTPPSENQTPAHGSYLEELRVRDGGRLLRIATDEIDRLESADHYVNAFVRGKTYTIHGSISGFETQLDPTRFARVHRTTIVNIGRIRELQSAGDGLYSIVLEDGTKHRIGRSFNDKLDLLRPRRRA